MALSFGESVKDNSARWIRCASVANLLLIRIWTDLFAYPRWPAHRDYGPPPASHYWSAMILVALLGTLLWALFSAVKSTYGRLAVSAGLGLLLAKEVYLAASALAGIQRVALLQLKWLALLVLALAALAWLIRRDGVRLARLSRPLGTALIPLAVLTLSQAVWRGTAASPMPERGFERTAAPGTTAARRVVWIVLDELDERVAFTQKRPGVHLPALERFRREANYVALHAQSPSSATLDSMPALLHQTAGASVFTRAHQAGLRSAVAGWAYPYCQVFQPTLASCAWWPVPAQHNTYGEGLQAVAGMGISLLETNQLSPLGQSRAVRQYARIVGEMTSAAEVLAARADLNLVLLHLPPPHNPYAYNPATGEIDRPVWRLPNAAGYLDNLVLADRIFARIRASMEKAGLWDRSTVLVTADHGFRTSFLLGYGPDDRHVPFMVKGATTGLPPANAQLKTVNTPDFILRWLTEL